MATVTNTTLHDTSEGRSDDAAYRHLTAYFDPETCRRLTEEDHVAWQRVCGILICIVTGGLLLGITAVLIAVV